MTTHTLAMEAQSIGGESPLAALVKLALAPVVCTLSLLACLYAYGQSFTFAYQLLAISAFLISAQVFGELPLSNGRHGYAMFSPDRAILGKWLFVVAVLLLLAFATKFSGLYSRRVTLTWFALTPFALGAAQAFARRALAGYLRDVGRPRLKAIVGASECGRRLAEAIRSDPSRGALLGYFDDRKPERLGEAPAGDYLGPVDQVAEYVKRHCVHVVYIALPNAREPRVGEMLRALRDTTASIYLIPSVLPLELTQARMELIGGVPAIAVCETPFCGINGLLKRAFDLVVASAALLLAWPLLGAIALGVKLSSPGPVLFKQRRYGLDGSEILVWKFRSMRVCEDGASVAQATRNDPRVTRFGAFLRRSSLDELPQLFNVLQGSMSIVGPRPHAVAHNEQYRRLIDGYMVRHKVRPGITGWAQVNGLRGETTDIELMNKRIEFDLDYLKHWSLSLDLWIVARTALVVLFDRHAY